MDEIKGNSRMSTYNNNTPIGFSGFSNGIEIRVYSGEYGFGISIFKNLFHKPPEYSEYIPIAFSFTIADLTYRYQTYLDRSTGELLCDIIHDPKITPVEEHLIAIHQYLKMRKLAE